MSIVGYLFGDEREEKHPYVLLMEGFESEKGGPDDPTIEVRFSDLWEAFEILLSVSNDPDLGRFEIRLGEPPHYEQILKEREEEGENPPPPND